MLLCRNASAVIGDGHRFVRVNRDVNLAAVARQGLIDTVVYQLKHHVMQARAVIGVTDVHAWALSHGIEALQYLNAGRIVVFLRGWVACLVSHGAQLSINLSMLNCVYRASTRQFGHVPRGTT